MIDNFALVPKPRFAGLTHQSATAYFNQLPKGAQLYIYASSHGEGLDERQPIMTNNNELIYYSYSLINREIITKEVIFKILEVCSYIDFKYGLILLLCLYEKVGAEKIQNNITSYFQNIHTDISHMRMERFMSRVSSFLTIFALEYVATPESHLL